MMKKISTFLQDTELRLWHIVVGFIAATVVTSGVDFYLAQNNRHTAILDARSNELSDVSSRFENKVSQFILSAKNFDEISDSEINLLLENINGQVVAINKIKPLISEKIGRDQIDQYTKSLIEIREILSDGLQYEETSRFGSTALQITQSRDQVLRTLSR